MAVTFFVDGSIRASRPVLPAGTRTRLLCGAYWRSSYPTPRSPPGMAIDSGICAGGAASTVAVQQATTIGMKTFISSAYASFSGRNFSELHEQHDVVCGLEHTADDQRPAEVGPLQESARDQRRESGGETARHVRDARSGGALLGWNHRHDEGLAGCDVHLRYGHAKQEARDRQRRR